MSNTKSGTTVPTTNGTAKPAEFPKNSTVKTTVPIVELPKKEQKEQPELPPLEDRILKIQMLGDLVAKREKLQDSLKKINSFKFSSETRLDKLTIEDEDNEFTTSNTSVLKDVVATIKTTVQRRLAEVDAQLTF